METKATTWSFASITPGRQLRKWARSRYGNLDAHIYLLCLLIHACWVLLTRKRSVPGSAKGIKSQTNGINKQTKRNLIYILMELHGVTGCILTSACICRSVSRIAPSAPESIYKVSRNISRQTNSSFDLAIHKDGRYLLIQRDMRGNGSPTLSCCPVLRLRCPVAANESNKSIQSSASKIIGLKTTPYRVNCCPVNLSWHT